MVNILRLYQGGGMGGTIILPNDVMEQPVAMMAALNLMSDFDARLRNEETGRLLNEDDGIDAVQQAKAEDNAMASWLAWK
ncbi:hypothetical protein TSA6c_00495 [Azospirillum sp. TSA6c]|uniref:hypothetical protein n=1 Tax=Azospirillum sp. TSA6c TaxID=709813 RepID=UPI000D6086EE|nr:hypothetical protein [Azospirillum sp. TSA6c]PWC54378.1 hypothetical protein TSA6c_00495 [Azospirillum sp. TSA6c]